MIDDKQCIVWSYKRNTQKRDTLFLFLELNKTLLGYFDPVNIVHR